MNLYTLLFVLFAGLKLANVIDWSWWLVTAPLWGSAVMGLIMFALAMAFSVFMDKEE